MFRKTSMVRLRSAYRLRLALLSVLFGTAPAHAELACTFDQMQINAASVIEPCSQLLETGGLTDADKAQAFYVRGRAYARTGRSALAAQDFDVSLKFAPERSDVLVSRAHAEGKLGRSDAEWSDLQRALTLNPKDARAWFALGEIYLNAGDPDQAVASFGSALAANPTEPYSLLTRSKIFAERHQFAEALADATALVDIPPATINKLGFVDNRGVMSDFHVVALNHRASLYEETGDQAAADRDLDAAVAEQASASTFRQRAESLLRHGRPEQALNDIDEAVRLDPADGDVHYLRGLILTGFGRYAEGLDAFDKAIAAHTRIIVSLKQVGMDFQMRARMLRGLGKTDDAVESVMQAVDISPEVKQSSIRAMTLRGYWQDGSDAQGEPFQAALRACMIDKDCN